MFKLPISEYPNLIPPSVIVSASYPGANPLTIAQTIANPIEDQLIGTQDMLYMSSQATTDGRLTLIATFKVGTDPELAQIRVQNRVSQALPRLPEITRQAGVSVQKNPPDLTMVVHLVSPDNSLNDLYLRNYALLNVKDELSRIAGVENVGLYGSGNYAIRIWLDPHKIAENELSAKDIIAAVKEQNIQAAGGIIGGAPESTFVEMQFPVNVSGRLTTPEEFGEVIIKTSEAGKIVKLRDVARVNLDATEFSLSSLVDNQTAAALLIYQSPNANAIKVSEATRATMDKLSKSFPKGMEYRIVYDPTVFVKSSIQSVIYTLFEALILVAIVVILFLQSWRAAIIPLVVVPVSIVGTFSLLWAFDFSINTLSLFGLILAIGIVVDDAIVVVENIERHIVKGLAPFEAACNAMHEVTGPIIAISLTLIAVFVPIAFVSGLTGQFYKQFAITIAISTAISAICSLTLSPALAAKLLTVEALKRDKDARLRNKYIENFFNRFDEKFLALEKNYSSSLSSALQKKGKIMLIYGILVAATIGAHNLIPKGFLPNQDKQFLIAFVQLPEGSTLSRTKKIVEEIGAIGLDEPGVENAVQFPGLSINGFTNNSSAGIVFFPLKPFSDRTSERLSAFAIANKLQKKFSKIEEGMVSVLPPPPILGLGTSSGFKLQIQDRQGTNYEDLHRIVEEIKNKAKDRDEVAYIYTNLNIDSPQLQADLDREKAKKLGLNIEDIFQTMQIYLGSLFINDFNMFGKTYQVIAQAEASYRDTPQDILNLKIKNNTGDMIPLGAVLTLKDTYGPSSASRYNGFLSADINGFPGRGYSSAQSQKVIADILDDTLPPGFTYEWTDLTYQEKLSGSTILYIFPLCIALVFLVLAAHYENWLLPAVVVTSVPLAVLSALFGVMMTDGDNNIFTQISLFVLAGLSCKNSILIVEFAKNLESRGLSTLEAIITASKIRLRPILMTSLAFIMGVTPMVFAVGAGSEMRSAVGIAVFTGMIGVTFFNLLFAPFFYTLLSSILPMRTAQGSDEGKTYIS